MKFSSFVIKLAISRNEFIPFYRPVVQTDSGVITGCEAQTHWLHPRYGLLNPERFITSVRENNVMMPVMMDLLNHIRLHITSFSSVISGTFTLSISCSCYLLFTPAFCKQLVKVTQRCQRAGITLLTELTVNEAVTSLPEVLSVAYSLRTQGVTFALKNYTGQRLDDDLLSTVRPAYIRPGNHFISRTPDAPPPYLRNKVTDDWPGDLHGQPVPLELILYYLEKQKREKRMSPVTDRQLTATH